MILILTAGYGEGHNAAAQGLLAAFQQRGCTAEIVDAFALGGGSTYQQSRRWYLEVINRAPKLWAFLFGLIDRWPLARWSLPFLGTVKTALAEVLEREKPFAVASVYPAYPYLLEKIYGSGPMPFFLHTIVTDSITINSVWFRCRSDSFVVANEDTARVMVGAGVPQEKVRVLGFPVRPRFAFSTVQRAHPWEVRPRVLYMVNAGKELAPAIVARLLECGVVDLTVTVGRDEELRGRVMEAAAGRHLEVYGWTDEMPELMMSHHVLIGKAGGATVQETIASRTPMVITQIVPGQEEGNARLLIENACGSLCETPEAIARQVASLFESGGALWRLWEQNIARLSRPDAALRVAELLEGSPKSRS
jgi:processive 1,2-diacylglycerol beta-glucosyltransferase